jgi:DDE superfamily endonuclease/Homeodomain-like domain-containing protein
LTEEERATLQRWARVRSVEARLVLRAKIVLAVAEGKENKDIAVELGTLRKTVGLWRQRFASGRLAGIEQGTPDDVDLHLIADNYATHKHPQVQRWPARHPRFHMHFTPTSSSWLNLVERWFREITQQRIRRGVFTSVKQLKAAIYDYIDEHNEHAKGFAWTATLTKSWPKSVARGLLSIRPHQLEALHQALLRQVTLISTRAAKEPPGGTIRSPASMPRSSSAKAPGTQV